VARKIKHPEHVNHERWLVSYADFITLLFAFFTVLYATAQTDQGKVNKLVGAVEKAFTAGIFSAGSDQLMFNDQGTARGNGVMDLGMNLREIETQLRLSIGDEGGGALRLERHADGLTLILQARQYFAPGSATLRSEALEPLRRAARILRLIRHRLRVEGHTASTGGSDPARTNWELSAARGLSVLRWLESQGVSAQRLSVAGYAEYRPLQPNTTAAGRARNRRVEIVILDEKPSFWRSLKPAAEGSSRPDEGWRPWIAERPAAAPAPTARPPAEAPHVRP